MGSSSHTPLPLLRLLKFFEWFTREYGFVRILPNIYKKVDKLDSKWFYTWYMTLKART